MTYNEQNPRDDRRGERRGERHGQGHGHRRGWGGWGGGFAAGFPFGPEGFAPVPPMPPMPGVHMHGERMGPGRQGRRARRGDVRMAILHLLNEEPRNGYQMIQELAERTDGMWKPSPGAIYPALSALEDEGMVTPDPENPKVYTLTDAGREAVEASAEAPWASFQDAGRDFQASEHGIVWKEFRKLAEAIRAVATNASPDQLSEAASILSKTRRDLFALLAADPVDDEEDDDPVDDLDQ